MTVILLIFYFLLGLIFGSFCNVLVDRGHAGKSIMGRSICDKCKRKLTWWENVPVLSFLLLRRHCRICKTRLSWQYPLVELGMGILFVLAAGSAGAFFTPASYGAGSGVINMGLMVKTTYFLTISFVLFAIFIWDLKYMIIPDQLIASGIIITSVYLLFGYLSHPGLLFSLSNPLISGLIGGVIIFGFFWLLYFYSKGKWIGGGDVKLGFLLGLIVGWRHAYLLLLLSYVSGAIVALTLIFIGKKKLQSKIPFGPFLVFATLTALFFGEKMIEWYWKIL